MDTLPPQDSNKSRILNLIRRIVSVYVRFEDTTVVTVKGTEFWDVTLYIPAVSFLLRLLFVDPEVYSSMFIRNVGKLLPDYTVSHLR
jgi:hypothetical protein